jgi:superoxide reductase
VTELKQVYKCNICGNMVEMVHASAGTLVCCNQPMALQQENTTDAATEKHVPVIERVNGGYKVVVGAVVHPMTEAHYIEWIELIADGRVYRQHLTPADAPEAFFPVDAAKVIVREYCNLHGLWRSEN